MTMGSTQFQSLLNFFGRNFGHLCEMQIKDSSKQCKDPRHRGEGIPSVKTPVVVFWSSNKELSPQVKKIASFVSAIVHCLTLLGLRCTSHRCWRSSSLAECRRLCYATWSSTMTTAVTTQQMIELAIHSTWYNKDLCTQMGVDMKALGVKTSSSCTFCIVDGVDHMKPFMRDYTGQQLATLTLWRQAFPRWFRVKPPFTMNEVIWK